VKGIIDSARWTGDAAQVAGPIVRRMMSSVYKRVAKQVIEKAGEALADKMVGMLADSAVAARLEDAVATRLGLIAKGVETAIKEVHTFITQAEDDGTPMPDMVAGVTRLYDDRAQSWADRIAAVSAVGSINVASLMAAQDLGCPRKQWLSRRDDKVRDTHEDADEQVQPLMKRFHLGGFGGHPKAELLFPGDPSPGVPLAEIMNCRCTLLFELPAGTKSDAPRIGPPMHLEVKGDDEPDTGICIVALPAAGAKVHSVGPEERKHCTVVFLGDQATHGIGDEKALNELVADLATQQAPFTAHVKEVGELGSEEEPAAVWLLERTGPIMELNTAAKSDATVAEMLESVKQYPKYLPHVTIGYPKADEGDWPAILEAAEGVSQVTFDRLAVWHGEARTIHKLTGGVKAAGIPLEVKDKVRTPGGVQQYGQPIGSTIRRNAPSLTPTFSAPGGSTPPGAGRSAGSGRPGRVLGRIDGVDVNDVSRDPRARALAEKHTGKPLPAYVKMAALQDRRGKIGAYVLWQDDTGPDPGKVEKVSVAPALRGRKIGDKLVALIPDDTDAGGPSSSRTTATAPAASPTAPAAAPAPGTAPALRGNPGSVYIKDRSARVAAGRVSGRSTSRRSSTTSCPSPVW
jgi:2'-5' RNA ligase